LNFGIWIRDDGWLRMSGAHRINVTIRYKVRRSERFVESIGSPNGLAGEVSPNENLFSVSSKSQENIFLLTGGI
jgi:hypothetical protein